MTQERVAQVVGASDALDATFSRGGHLGKGVTGQARPVWCLPPCPLCRLEQLLDALELAHAAGIVHRDVKPANVVLPARDHVKVADFGIAAIQGDPQLTSSGMVLGSPACMAPEQAGGHRSGPPVDLWSARPCTIARPGNS